MSISGCDTFDISPFKEFNKAVALSFSASTSISISFNDLEIGSSVFFLSATVTFAAALSESFSSSSNESSSSPLLVPVAPDAPELAGPDFASSAGPLAAGFLAAAAGPLLAFFFAAAAGPLLAFFFAATGLASSFSSSVALTPTACTVPVALGAISSWIVVVGITLISSWFGLSLHVKLASFHPSEQFL